MQREKQSQGPSRKGNICLCTLGLHWLFEHWLGFGCKENELYCSNSKDKKIWSYLKLLVCSFLFDSDHRPDSNVNIINADSMVATLEDVYVKMEDGSLCEAASCVLCQLNQDSNMFLFRILLQSYECRFQLRMDPCWPVIWKICLECCISCSQKYYDFWIL